MVAPSIRAKKPSRKSKTQQIQAILWNTLELSVGSLDVDLINFKGLKHPFSIIVNE